MFLRSGSVPVILAAACIGAPAVAATPTLMWQDARRVAVHCLVEQTTGANRQLQQSLCARARTLAARGAPVPVTVVSTGDPTIFAPGTVTLLVHASMQPARTGGLLAFSIRPYRVSADQNTVLFGAAPRAVALPASGGLGTALDGVLVGRCR